MQVLRLLHGSDGWQHGDDDRQGRCAAAAPGGVVVILDALPAQNAVMRAILYVWLELIMPHVARLFTRDEKAYRYLSASIRSTVPPQRVANMLRDCGAGRVDVTRYTFGAAARIVAHKPGVAATLS